MPACPVCHAIPGEKHTYADSGKPCPGFSRLNPITKEDTAPFTVTEA